MNSPLAIGPFNYRIAISLRINFFWGCPALWSGRAVSQLAGLLGPALFSLRSISWFWPFGPLLPIPQPVASLLYIQKYTLMSTPTLVSILAKDFPALKAQEEAQLEEATGPSATLLPRSFARGFFSALLPLGYSRT